MQAAAHNAMEGAKRAAGKLLLSKMSLAQQRMLLNKVKELTPIKDPFGVL